MQLRTAFSSHAASSGSGPAANHFRVAAMVLGVVLVWQVLFWPIVHAAESAARPPGADQRQEIDYQFIDEQGEPAGDGSVFKAERREAPLGYLVKETSDAPRVRFSIPFEVSDPDAPLALYLAVRNSVDEVRINGEAMQSMSALPRLNGLVTSEPGYAPIPSEHLRLGTNILTVETPNFGSQWLSEFEIGPSAPLASTYRWKNMLQTDVALIGLAILAFTILLCLVVRWPAEDRPRIMALVALLSVCAFSTYILTFNPPVPISLGVTVFLYVLSNLFIAVAVLAHVLYDQRRPVAWIRHLSLAWLASIMICAVGLAGAEIIGPANAWYRNFINGSFWVVIIAGSAAIAMLATGLVRDGGARWFERSILAFCISAFIVDRLGTIIPLSSPFDSSMQLTLGLSQIVGGLLGLSMVVALAREATEARRTVLSANDVLRTKLAEREAELKVSHAREQDVLKRSVLLEERQRIVRDMHDGIGGQLLGLSMQVRAQRLDQTALSQALDTSIADLRLIVDSLDSAEDTLADALLAFEHRARAQADSVKCAYTTSILIDPDAAGIGPRATLQVLRILQEALTNALRHGQPTEVQLIADNTAEGAVEIRLVDNGRGISEAGTRGVGLRNMKSRAMSIGATLDIQSSSAGTAVCIQLPAAHERIQKGVSP